MIKRKKKFSRTRINKKITYRNYKNTEFLKIFLTPHGKILPRRITELTVQQQKKITKAIKRARILSFLPFISSNSIF